MMTLVIGLGLDYQGGNLPFSVTELSVDKD